MQKKVIIKKLNALHQQESFTRFLPLNAPLVQEIKRSVNIIFDELGGASLLKSSGEVYIKPNAVDAKAYSHTRVEVLRAVIRYWKKAGAKKIYLFENSTQANYTRIVFKATGYTKICKETGAIPVFLDEDKSKIFSFKRDPSCSTDNSDGYRLSSFNMPETVVRLIEEKDQHLYINVPKLKTHSMGVVTLGVKNQWGFPMHRSRSVDHNDKLHSKLVDILAYIQPDVTLIEGVEGTIHGHYFATALADRQVRPFRVLIGSRNVVAADIVGAKIFGLDLSDIPHLRLAVDKGLGGLVKGLEDIDLAGDVDHLERVDLLGDMPTSGHYPWTLYDAFPKDVPVIYGKTRACMEGCVNNPLCVLQTMHFDHGGKGGWTLVVGKGHDADLIDALEGRVLIVGHCAIDELSARLIKRLGRENVYLSGECNDLCATVEAMFHLMKVNPAFYTPLNPISTGIAMLMAKLNGSTSRVPHPLSHIFKRV